MTAIRFQSPARTLMIAAGLTMEVPMPRIVALTLAAVALAAASLDAHHSYAVFDREHPVSIEGDIERVVFGNPHVILAVRAADAACGIARTVRINS